jgi:glycosyltransferase involved in cell wall biosynthesis
MVENGSSMISSEQSSFKVYDKKPTILQVIPSLKSGGAEIEAFEVGKAILRAGGHAIIVARTHSVEMDAQAQAIEFVDLPLDTKNPFKIYKNTQYLKELIKHKKIDIVHARSRAPAWSAYYACRSLKIPFVTTHHAAYNAKTFFKSFYNSIMAKGDRVIAISRFIENHLLEKYAHYPWFDTSNRKNH